MILPFSAHSGPIRQSAGVVSGLYSPCFGGGPEILDLDFHGRMPAGGSNYTVIGGAANAFWDCGAETIPFSMYGASPAGLQFFWHCPATMREILPEVATVPVDSVALHPGLTWRIAGLCTGSATFKLTIAVTTVYQDESFYGRQLYHIAGFYLTNR